MGECARCVALTRELREAKELLAEYERPGEAMAGDVYRVREWIGCQVQTAKLLLMLLKVPGRVVPRDRLLIGIDFNGDTEGTRILQVVASRLRSNLSASGLPRAVKSAHGTGYYIDQKDAAVIAAEMEKRL